MGNVVTRAAFVGATTGAVLVGKFALVGATVTMALASSSLQMFRRAWDSSSGKVTPLPPTHQLPQVAITNLIIPDSDSNRETVQEFSRSSKSAPTLPADSSPSPRCVRHVEDQQEDLLLAPSTSTHSPDLGGIVGDLPPSGLDSPLRPRPCPTLNRAPRMRRTSEDKYSRKSARVSRNHVEGSSNANLSPAEQQNSSCPGFFLAAIGPLIGLAGLFAGRILAVLIVVCWLYAIPSIRITAVEKQAVESTNSEESGKADHKDMKRNLSSTLSKRERRPCDYKKQVIMEGILERDRRLTCRRKLKGIC